MSDRSLAFSFLGGAAVVVLSGAAAYVATTLARSDAPAPSSSAAPAAPSDATLQAIERRLGYIEQRLDLAEQKAETAMTLARSADEGRRESAAATGAAKPATHEPAKERPDAAGEVKPPEPPVDRDDGADGQMATLRDLHHTATRNFVIHQMKMLGDASQEGAAMRFAQALTEAKSLMTRFGLRGNELDDKVRKIFEESYEAAARDVGPLVRDGLERADIATVRQRIRAVGAETDQKLKPLLDEETWKKYEEAVAGSRRSAEQILEEFEKARLSGK
jgi:hypothetical protein